MNSTHGGYIGFNKDSVIDFSANINPLGLYPSANTFIKKLAVNTHNLIHYPEIKPDSLIKKLARYYEVSDNSIVCSSGAADFIYLYTQYLSCKKDFYPLIIEPAFNEYESAIKSANVKDLTIEHFELNKENDYTFTEKDFPRFEKYIDKGVNAVYLASPSNPTGKIIDINVIKKLCKLCAWRNVYILIDICFAQFDKDYFMELKKLIKNGKEYKTTVIVNAFTKFYGCAGLRSGYGIVFDTELCKSLYSNIRPWALSYEAAKMSEKIIDNELVDFSWTEKSSRLIEGEKKRLYQAFDNCKIDYIKSNANYIVFFDEKRNLKKLLADYKIIIRDLQDYFSLSLKNAYRICVSTPDNNSIFIDSLSKICGIKSGLSDKRKKAVPIMIQGTMSDAGKSLFAAALCRIFTKDGYKVSPFKSQNMALNSGVTLDGSEMGRAQIMQAEACGTEPSVYMNPILLKPASDHKSQVIVKGRALATMDAKQYFAYRGALKDTIMDCYNHLAEQNDIIVIEGAGSPAEINLKENDIVNMGLADMTDSPVILVGDIDRGGVFASLYGTAALVSEEERKRIKGFVINKFRGDVKLLENGFGMLKDLTGIGVLGVVPYISDLKLDDEDSLSIDKKLNKNKEEVCIHVQCPKLPYMSNFTDLYPLSYQSFIKVSYFNSREEYIKNEELWGQTDLILLSGTKNTIACASFLSQSKLDIFIKEQRKKGVALLGICGGFQLLGCEMCDSEGHEDESKVKSLAGLALLDIKTTFTDKKTLTKTSGSFCNISGYFSFLNDAKYTGYEIHSGFSEKNGRQLLYDYKDNVFGTYIHGLFDSIDVLQSFTDNVLVQKNLKPKKVVSYFEMKNKEYDRLSSLVKENIDMNEIYDILKERGLELKK